MPSDATYHDFASAAQTHAPTADRSLPAGAGLVLAVLLGSMIWIGIFAMLM